MAAMSEFAQPVSDAPSLVLGVLTFRRNDLLAAVLPRLADQLRAAQQMGHQVRLQVVDNDPDSGARSVVEGLELGVETRYAHEPRPGLSAARNRLLTEAGEARLLACIDDDEQPGEGWLASLLQTWRESGAQAVTGPVRSEPEGEVDPWTEGTALFARPSHPTGSERPGLATNNLLLDLDFVREHGLRFDDRFGLTGGEDSRFGQALRTAGGRIVWCDEAEVSETVPAARLERRWINDRLVRFGESWVRVRGIDLKGKEALMFRGTALVKGVMKTVEGQAKVVRARRENDPRTEGHWAGERAGGIGLVRGALGINRQEYARKG